MVALSAWTVAAQEPRLRFDVASVTRNLSGEPGFGGITATAAAVPAFPGARAQEAVFKAFDQGRGAHARRESPRADRIHRILTEGTAQDVDRAITSAGSIGGPGECTGSSADHGMRHGWPCW